ncbi:MAG: hypothetical protein ACNA8H_11285, partial [Anaerolineales bacterium]
LHDDHMVDLILRNFGEERENTPVQFLINDISECEIHVIEIHYGNYDLPDNYDEIVERIMEDADYKVIEGPERVTYYRGRDQYTISRQEEILIVDGFEYRA